MRININGLLLVLFLALISTILYGCNPVNVVKADPIPSKELQERIPEEIIIVRDNVLAHLKEHAIENAPDQNIVWNGNNTTAPSVVGGAQFEFISDDWQMIISFPIVSPDAVIYSVTIKNPATGFKWEGEVNADGVVDESANELSFEPEINTEIKTELDYINETFGFSFRYPSKWSLDEYSLDPLEGDERASHVVALNTDTYKLLIHMKFLDDHSVIGGGLGAGEIYQESGVSLLGETINRNKLIYEKETKLVWYSLPYGELEIFIRLENTDQSSYEEINIPDSIISEVEEILNTVSKTGSSITGNQTPPSEIYTSLESTDGIAVEGWVGVIISMPDMPQIDDYFQMVNQDGGRYGILSQDSELQEQLDSYRDSEVMIKIWGTLYEGRMDAYNTQIEVTRIEEVGNNQVETSSVEDWVGIIVSNPVGAQFDDFFQMKDQGENRYGVDSLNEEIREELVALRDSGKTIHVWGTLYKNVPDAYGYQIQVARVEVEG